MIKQIFILLGIALVVASCEKTDSKPDNFKDVKVRTLDGANLKYDGEKLVKMGAEEFFYDSNDRLTRSVSKTVVYFPYQGDSRDPRVGELARINTISAAMCESSTTPPPIEKMDSIQYINSYSYHWEQNKVKKIRLESLIKKTYLDGLAKEEVIVTNQPYSEFFYKNDRVDSISYIEYGERKASENYITYTYNTKGNVVKVLSKELASGSISPDLCNPLFTTYTDDYDSNSNPYYLISRRLGTLIPSMFNNNLTETDLGVYCSPNNPLNSRRGYAINIDNSKLSEGSRTVNPNIEIQPSKYLYQYNAKGLPLTVTVSSDLSEESYIKTYTYYD